MVFAAANQYLWDYVTAVQP